MDKVLRSRVIRFRRRRQAGLSNVAGLGSRRAAGIRAGAAFAVFCALSSAVYLFNDLADREADRLHPTKRFRPIASGAVAPAVAGTTAALALLRAARHVAELHGGLMSVDCLDGSTTLTRKKSR